jgi:Rrf2 family protein
MFSKETEYALRGLVYIKLQNLKSHRPGTSEIAKEIDAPPFYTAKILQRLVRAGFLRSIKGKGGGFYFDPGQAEQPLINLIAATEGDSTYSGCGFGLKKCDDNDPCPMHEKYAAVRKSVNDMISGESVGSLAEKAYQKELGLSNHKL